MTPDEIEMYEIMIEDQEKRQRERANDSITASSTTSSTSSAAYTTPTHSSQRSSGNNRQSLTTSSASLEVPSNSFPQPRHGQEDEDFDPAESYLDDFDPMEEESYQYSKAINPVRKAELSSVARSFSFTGFSQNSQGSNAGDAQKENAVGTTALDVLNNPMISSRASFISRALERHDAATHTSVSQARQQQLGREGDNEEGNYGDERNNFDRSNVIIDDVSDNSRGKGGALRRNQALGPATMEAVNEEYVLADRHYNTLHANALLGDLPIHPQPTHETEMAFVKREFVPKFSQSQSQHHSQYYSQSSLRAQAGDEEEWNAFTEKVSTKQQLHQGSQQQHGEEPQQQQLQQSQQQLQQSQQQLQQPQQQQRLGRKDYGDDDHFDHNELDFDALIDEEELIRGEEQNRLDFDVEEAEFLFSRQEPQQQQPQFQAPRQSSSTTHEKVRVSSSSVRQMHAPSVSAACGLSIRSVVFSRAPDDKLSLSLTSFVPLGHQGSGLRASSSSSSSFFSVSSNPIVGLLSALGFGPGSRLGAIHPSLASPSSVTGERCPTVSTRVFVSLEEDETHARRIAYRVQQHKQVLSVNAVSSASGNTPFPLPQLRKTSLLARPIEDLLSQIDAERMEVTLRASRKAFRKEQKQRLHAKREARNEERKIAALSSGSIDFAYDSDTEDDSESDDETSEDDLVIVESNSTENIDSSLLTDKYQPKTYTELLSSEYSNRRVLTWMQSWASLVFRTDGTLKTKTGKVTNGTVLSSDSSQTFSTETPFGLALPYASLTREGNTSGSNPHTATIKSTECLDGPEQKVILLSGPPGAGKTTLAHVVATHCGYRVVEVNASDDRAFDAVSAKIKATVETVSALGNGLPNCLILDEIDGALGGDSGESEAGPKSVVSLLVEMIKQAKLRDTLKKERKAGGDDSYAVEAKSDDEDDNMNKDNDKDKDKNKAKNTSGIIVRKKNKTKSKRLPPGLNRPIILICNDHTAPCLRSLLPHVNLIHVDPIETQALVARLKTICRRERISHEGRALTALAELVNGDVRSCLHTLHFTRAKRVPLTVSSLSRLSVGEKDLGRDPSSFWADALSLTIPTGAAGGLYSGNSMRDRLGPGDGQCDRYGEYDIQGFDGRNAREIAKDAKAQKRAQLRADRQRVLLAGLQASSASSDAFSTMEFQTVSSGKAEDMPVLFRSNIPGRAGQAGYMAVSQTRTEAGATGLTPAQALAVVRASRAQDVDVDHKHAGDIGDVTNTTNNSQLVSKPRMTPAMALARDFFLFFPSVVADHGIGNKVLDGVHHNYPAVTTTDPLFTRFSAASDWFSFADLSTRAGFGSNGGGGGFGSANGEGSNADYILSYSVLAIRQLVANTASVRVEVPKAVHAFQRRAIGNDSTLRDFLRSTSTNTTVLTPDGSINTTPKPPRAGFLQMLSARSCVVEVLSSVLDLVAPPLKSPSFHLMAPEEKAKVMNLVSVMVGLGLTWSPSRDSGYSSHAHDKTGLTTTTGGGGSFKSNFFAKTGMKASKDSHSRGDQGRDKSQNTSGSGVGSQSNWGSVFYTLSPDLESLALFTYSEDPSIYEYSVGMQLAGRTYNKHHGGVSNTVVQTLKTMNPYQIKQLNMSCGAPNRFTLMTAVKQALIIEIEYEKMRQSETKAVSSPLPTTSTASAFTSGFDSFPIALTPSHRSSTANNTSNVSSATTSTPKTGGISSSTTHKTPSSAVGPGGVIKKRLNGHGSAGAAASAHINHGGIKGYITRVSNRTPKAPVVRSFPNPADSLVFEDALQQQPIKRKLPTIEGEDGEVGEISENTEANEIPKEEAGEDDKENHHDGKNPKKIKHALHFSFMEGFSNAVKRPVSMKSFL